MITTTMKLVALGLLACIVSATPASAITVKKAHINNGALEVRGKEAAPGATITLDGVSTGAVASGSGSFKASAVALPSDCIVTIADGVSTVDAVVKNCGPVGGFRLLDAGGSELGRVVKGDAAGYEVYVEGVGKLVTVRTPGGFNFATGPDRRPPHMRRVHQCTFCSRAARGRHISKLVMPTTITSIQCWATTRASLPYRRSCRCNKRQLTAQPEVRADREKRDIFPRSADRDG